MKAFVIVFAVVLAVASCADDDVCYKDVDAACSSTLTKQPEEITKCDAKYGAITEIQSDLQRFTNHLFFRSFDFLLMATHYGNYIKNRPGFEKLFRELSDSLWEDGIDTIKYITSRGGEMNFANVNNELQDEENLGASLELPELKAMAKALDIEKKLAKETFSLYGKSADKKAANNDPEIAHHMEEKFMEKHRETIRKLAGHTKDLSKLLDGPDASLALYLFDEYLKK